jgi:biopolymer transport protein ExbB
MKIRVSAIVAALLISVASLTPAYAQQEAPAAPSAEVTTETAPPESVATDDAGAADAGIATDETETVEIENPYGLEALWRTGDFVSKGTLLVLVIMSMGSWYILVTKLIDQIRMKGQAREAREKFWKSPSVQAGTNSLKQGSPFRYIAESGLKATDHHDGALLEQIDLNTWVTMSIQRAVEKVQSRLQDGLAFLATVGSTAPFVGLFGTVWGIYHALTAIGVAGQASIDKVAGPVGEALIMTAIGLGVAVPAVLGYNWLVRRNKGVMEDVRSFSSDLHSVLLSGAMSTSEAGRNATVKKVG